MDGARELVHATAIAIDGRAALIRGPSGCGKSDLALRCLVNAPSRLLPDQVDLVADDQVILSRHDNAILVTSPDSIRGKLEARGIGILNVPIVEEAQLVLVADLVAPGSFERLPDSGRRVTLLGLDFPAVEITPFEGSAALKLLLALKHAGHAASEA